MTMIYARAVSHFLLYIHPLEVEALAHGSYSILNKEGQ